MSDDDIVNRLRAMKPDGPFAPTPMWAPYRGADEIARLRAERDAARAEVERLRNEIKDVNSKIGDIRQVSAQTMRIALGMLSEQIRAALQEGEAARATQAPSEGEEG